MFVVSVVWIVCIGYLLVFFFKQKTAYEMRISDWSSDVCSSDLGAQSAKCLDAAEIRMHRVMPALFAADRIRRAGIAECRMQSVVAALAMRVTARKSVV